MPFHSKAQQRWMFAAESRGELQKGTARRWAHETDFKKLPERAKKMDEKSKEAKALTSKERKKLSLRAFVFPAERRYPIHDVSHARNALARSSGKAEEAQVRSAVYARYPELKKTASEKDDSAVKSVGKGAAIGATVGAAGSGASTLVRKKILDKMEAKSVRRVTMHPFPSHEVFAEHMKNVRSTFKGARRDLLSSATPRATKAALVGAAVGGGLAARKHFKKKEELTKSAAMMEVLAEKRAESLKGGLADGKKDDSFPKDQVEKGKKVEREHTDDPKKAKEIAKDHLVEDKKYYDKLEKMEKRAFSITREGHKYDAELAKLRGEHGAKVKKLVEEHGGLDSIGKALRFGAAEQQYTTFDPRHQEYVEKKHRAGKNAWNPWGGMKTPSKHEKNANAMGTPGTIDIINGPWRAPGTIEVINGPWRAPGTYEIVKPKKMKKLAAAEPGEQKTVGQSVRKGALTGASIGAATGVASGAYAAHRLHPVIKAALGRKDHAKVMLKTMGTAAGRQAAVGATIGAGVGLYKGLKNKKQTAPMEKAAFKKTKKNDLDDAPLNTFERHPKKILAGGAALIAAAIGAKKVKSLGGLKASVKAWKEWRATEAAKRYKPNWTHVSGDKVKFESPVSSPVRKSKTEVIDRHFGVRPKKTAKLKIKHRASLRDLRDHVRGSNKGHSLPAPKKDFGPKKDVTPPKAPRMTPQLKQKLEDSGAIVLPPRRDGGSHLPPPTDKKLKRLKRREGKQKTKKTLKDLGERTPYDDDGAYE